MRPFLCVLLLSVSTLAGCLAGDDGVAPADEPDVQALPDGLTAFTASGTLLRAAPDLTLGTTWWLPTGHRGAEPNMGITSSGAVFATAGSETIRSLDRGETWEVVYEIGIQGTQYRSWDPMMWYDPVTDIIYTDPMFPPLLCSNLAWSTDDGDSWTTNPAVCHPPPMDHQKLFSGVPGPSAPPLAGVAHPTVLYQCYNQILATQCGISYDGGLSWPLTTKVADDVNEGCGGTNGHGIVSSEGVAAVPVSSCDELGIGFTHDSGLSFEFVKVPGNIGVTSFDPDLVFDDDERLWALWRGDDHRTYLVTTPDYGATWTDPIDVTPPGVASTFFHTMNLGDDGRIAMSYLGAESWDGDPNDAPVTTHWHLYIVTSEERDAPDPVYLSRQVTPDDDPVHVGQICTGGIGCSTGRELLEFIDSAIAPDGTFFVVYTESCLSSCAANEHPEEKDKDGRIVSLARLDDWPMYATTDDEPAATNVTGASPLPRIPGSS